jgi:hypothetical protein
MLRKLLTLFALLTGLAAIAAPAEARFSGLADVRVELASSGAAQCHAAQLAAVERPANIALDERGHAPSCPRPVYRVYIPVLQLSDRARE